MKRNVFRKSLVIGIIILFVGASAVSGLNNKTVEINEIENINRDVLIFNPKDDATVSDYKPDENFGNKKYIAVCNKYGATPDWESNIFIKFDISSIPSSTYIVSAMLHLYYYAWTENNPAGRPLTVYRVKNDWSEDAITYNNQPDVEEAVSSSANVPGSTEAWMTWDLTNDVQSFNNEEKTNYGWKIMDETYWGTINIPSAYFRSKEYDNEDFFPYLEIEYAPNQPPEAPTINGPPSGSPGTEYFYRFVTNDPNNDDVYFWIEWGDGDIEKWIGPYASGEEEILGHTWDEKGTYTIEAKTKDIHGAESEWGTLTVTMPRNKAIMNTPFLQNFLQQYPILYQLLQRFLRL